MDNRRQLTQLLYKTISDINVWHDVLREISLLTGASRCIIMQRDKKTAELYITQSIYIDLESPVVYGFSDDETESYITHFYQSDPWTEIELKNHPIVPYAMSSYLPIEKLKESDFWPWLAPQGINDTAVTEVFNSAGYWVSINLYFDGYNEVVKKKCLDLLSEYKRLMSEVWELGQQFRLSKSSPESLFYFLEQQKSPSFLVDSNSKVIKANNKGLALLDSTDCFLNIKDNLLFIKSSEMRGRLRDEISVLSERKYIVENPPKTSFNIGELAFHCTLLGNGEDIIGRDTALRLVSIESREELLSELLSPIWEVSSLTRRERELVEVIASGGRVVDFMNKYGIAKSTAHAHWGKVKEKLQVKDRSEIYAHHKLFLEN